MKHETISLLRSPVNGLPFKLAAERGDRHMLQEWLIAVDDSHRFPVLGGIPSFIDDDGMARNGRAAATGLAGKLLSLAGSGQEKLRQEILKALEIRTRDRVLGLTIGSGSDFKELHHNAEFYGVDTSLESLKQTQKNLQKWRVEAELIHALPESLPFDGATFDQIFHLDGMGVFGNKAAVLAEIIRVAKPGAQILIGGEVSELAKLGDPAGLIPSYMLDVQSERAGNGKLYVVSFRTPYDDVQGSDVRQYRNVGESRR